jgi:hypothetical protein
MNPTEIALLGYISLMIVLLFAIGGYRAALSLTGKRAANSFSPAGDDVSDMTKRLCRTHANCYEAFPVIGGILLFALATNNTVITDPLAMLLIGFRVLQSVTHLASTSVFAVYLRFTFFVIQLGIVIYWILLFFGHLPV